MAAYTNGNDEEQPISEEPEPGRRKPWMPPGADADVESEVLFGDETESHFWIPQRLTDKSSSLVMAVNDFHFAMVNDHPRNEFFRKALTKVISPATHVLEIGTGSGLLAMIAAQLGAQHVTAIEANGHMAALARENIAANGMSERITVLNAMSTEVGVDRLAPHGPADVLVSEILGTLMLGESALDYTADVRTRGLIAPGASVVPRFGRQCVTLIESADLESITRCTGWGGLDLSQLNQLQDTASLVFTKQFGFRISSCVHRYLADRIVVADVDFARTGPNDMPLERTFSIRANASGVVHAVLCSWEVSAEEDPDLCMTTHPEDTVANFPRDMQVRRGAPRALSPPFPPLPQHRARAI